MKDDFKKTLGQAIRKIRRNKDISQENLAFKLGNRDQSYISQIETGKINFTVETLGRILDALNISMKDLEQK